MILVVMAAGMGSRFGGMKQLTPVGKNGEFIIDYSIYDAIIAGVKKILFVIRKENLEDFRNTIGKRIEKRIEVKYIFQQLDDTPIKVISNRTKPWGTGQALYACREGIDDNFIVINADDFYGREAFLTLASELKKINNKGLTLKKYLMIGYQLKNTLSKNGLVSRGTCEVEDNYLKSVTERKKVGYSSSKIISKEEGRKVILNPNTIVSVNLFGFTKEILPDIKTYFNDFLRETPDLDNDEFYIPTIVQKSINDGQASVLVKETTAKFMGMTYREDLDELAQNIEKLVQEGLYPSNLWS